MKPLHDELRWRGIEYHLYHLLDQDLHHAICYKIRHNIRFILFTYSCKNIRSKLNTTPYLNEYRKNGLL